jgi:hypothetical protein
MKRALLLLVAATAAPALASDTAEPPAVSARAAADAGGFSPWTLGARTDGGRALVFVQGGYDAARGGATADGVVEARLTDRLALRAGASVAGPDGGARPILGGRLDVLRQGADGGGLDVALAAGYEPQGFNTVPAVAITAAAGRRFGALTVAANLGAGAGLEEGEVYGDARMAAHVRVARDLRLGVDSRLRLDLERDADEPEGEPDWELVAGPTATLTAGRFAVTGGAGVSAVRLRLSAEGRAGALVHLGLGMVF